MEPIHVDNAVFSTLLIVLFILGNCVVIVVEKSLSLPNASANSLSVFSASGAVSINSAIIVST